MGCRWFAFDMGFRFYATLIQHGGWVWGAEGMWWKIGCGGKVEKWQKNPETGWFRDFCRLFRHKLPTQKVLREAGFSEG
ncbi:MAG: hypothetical protein IJS55_02070 [Oscillospiraceae bacterium]|nr:hypothetical protein [Oscillospiraceae bacterium]